MADTDTNSPLPDAPGGTHFFSVLLDFILGRESNPQRKEMQAAQKQLYKTGYRFYKLSKDRLLPPFASFLYGIYGTVDPLREFFLTDTSDKYYAGAVIQYFRTDKMSRLASSISEEALEERAKGKGFPALKDEAHKLFDSLSEMVGKELSGKMNAMYNSVIVLKQFCLVDYYAILKRFKPDLAEHRFAPDISFGQTPRKFALDLVPDFLAATANLLCVDNWDAQFEFIASLPGFGGFDKKRFDAMYDTLLKMNTLGAFANFGRLLLQDASYSAQPDFPDYDVAKAYLDALSHAMEETLHEIDAKKKQELLDFQMREVFGGAKIADLQNYTEDSSEVLENLEVNLEDGKKISYTKYAQVKYFHTLVEVYLSKKLLEFVEIFTVRANLLGSDYSSKFSAEYHQMLSVDDEIKKLDMELGQGFPNGYKIVMLVDAASHSHDAAEKLYKEINIVNLQFSEQLGTGMDILHVVYRKLSDLLEDRKSLGPSIVKNWNTIDEYLREPSLQTLTEAHSRLSHFIALMGGSKPRS